MWKRVPSDDSLPHPLCSCLLCRLGLDKIPGDADVIAIDGNSYSQVLELRAHDIVIVTSSRSLGHELLVDSEDQSIEVRSGIRIPIANILAPGSHRPPGVCDPCAGRVFTGALVPNTTISNGEPQRTVRASGVSQGIIPGVERKSCGCTLIVDQVERIVFEAGDIRATGTGLATLFPLVIYQKPLEAGLVL